MTHDDFLKMQVIGETIHNLHLAYTPIAHKADGIVKRYIRSHFKDKEAFIERMEVEYLWDEILVSYKYTVDTFGFETEPQERYETFRLTYEQVFGWHHSGSDKISAKWARKYATELVDSFFPKPPELTYDI